MASRAAGSRLLVGCRTPGVGNLFLVLLAVLLLSSCASYQARDRFPSVRTDDGTRCSRFYEKMAGATAPVRDARYHAIPGLPWLRTSRFLSGFSDRQDSQVVRALLREQNRLARESLRLEWGNLSQTDRAAADFPSNDIEHTLTLCGERLNTALLRDREALRSWRANMAVPDDYHTLWRVAGLYPLVAPVFRQAVAVEQREADRLAAGLLNQLRRRPADFRLYTWPAPVTEQSPLSTATRNALGQAQLSAVEREALLARHAPRWWVKTGSGDDRIGTVRRRRRAAGGYRTAGPLHHDYLGPVPGRDYRPTQLHGLVPGDTGGGATGSGGGQAGFPLVAGASGPGGQGAGVRQRSRLWLLVQVLARGGPAGRSAPGTLHRAGLDRGTVAGRAP